MRQLWLIILFEATAPIPDDQLPEIAGAKRAETSGRFGVALPADARSKCAASGRRRGSRSSRVRAAVSSEQHDPRKPDIPRPVAFRAESRRYWRKRAPGAPAGAKGKTALGFHGHQSRFSGEERRVL